MTQLHISLFLCLLTNPPKPVVPHIRTSCINFAMSTCGSEDSDSAVALNTADAVDIPYVVTKPSNKHPFNWKRADVLEFIDTNKEGYDLDDEYIRIISQNQVAGRALLGLTRAELVKHPYNLPGGAAAAIEQLTSTLKTPDRKL